MKKSPGANLAKAANPSQKPRTISAGVRKAIPPKFDAEQRRQLRDLGLFAERISELEGALPICAAMLRKPSTLRDVLEEFERVTAAVRSARKSLARIARATTTRPAALEVRNRTLEADFADGTGIDSVGGAFAALIAVEANIDRALASLPRKARKGGSANPWPIARIEKALLDGFVAHHRPPFPPYDIETSLNKRPFPDIVAICYEAIGGPGQKFPERAIREHLRLKRRRRLDAKY